MAKTGAVHARLDPQLKTNVENILSQIGLTPSDAVNLFFRQIELNNGLPFELKIPRPNAETIAAIEETEQIIKETKAGKRKGYTDMNELWKDLEK